jgi:23S rRNA (pseudouridine1915-N3)-methyltransferase
VRIVVVAVGRLRAPYVDDVGHYRKLLSGYTRLELVEVRGDEQIPRRVPERAYVSLLDRDGEQLDSIAFSRFLEDRRRDGRELCFVIGGPFGTTLERAEHRFSLGSLTLPHQLARVVLLEQLYRAHRILTGAPYHY